MLVSFFHLGPFHLPEVTHETFIAYKVLEVFPRGRRVVITCHSPQAPPPVTYSLWAGQGTEVAKKVVKTGDPASFSINITLKSRPDLLSYSCQAASPEGTHSASTKLQMYWELWTSECTWGAGGGAGSGLEGRRWGTGQVAHLQGHSGSLRPASRTVQLLAGPQGTISQQGPLGRAEVTRAGAPSVELWPHADKVGTFVFYLVQSSQQLASGVCGSWPM